MTNERNEFDDKKDYTTFDPHTNLDHDSISLVSGGSGSGKSEISSAQEDVQMNHGSTVAPEDDTVMEPEDDAAMESEDDIDDLVLKKIEEERALHQPRTASVTEGADLRAPDQEQTLPSIDPQMTHASTPQESTPLVAPLAPTATSSNTTTFSDPAQEAREAYLHNHMNSTPSPLAPSTTMTYTPEYDEPEDKFNNTLPFLSLVLAFMIPVLGGILGFFVYFTTDKRNSVGRAVSLVSIAYTTAMLIVLAIFALIFLTTLVPALYSIANDPSLATEPSLRN